MIAGLFHSAGDFDADQTLWLQPQQRDREFIVEVSLIPHVHHGVLSAPACVGRCLSQTVRAYVDVAFCRKGIISAAWPGLVDGGLQTNGKNTKVERDLSGSAGKA